MNEHIEVVACPQCGKDIAVTLAWYAGEAPSRDCPGLPPQWDVLAYGYCTPGCYPTSSQWDAIDAEAKAQATYTMQEQQREMAP